jgi:hypothetical protein
MLHGEPMSAIMLEAETFNNRLDFERGLWWYQTTVFADVPKRRVLETSKCINLTVV